MADKTRIVGAILDKERLTLYKEDGNTLIIKQGDERVSQILKDIMPIIQAGGVAEIELGTSSPYAHFEKKSGIKFFRVLKEKVKHIFDREDELPSELNIGKTTGQAPVKPAAPASKPVPTTAQKVEQVMEGAKEEEAAKKSPARVEALGAGLLTPASRVSDGQEDLRNDETIVAVTRDGTVIPGVEKLKGQFDHVRRGDNPQGLERLLERLGKMIHTRQHSVEDILRFLERGDLPIADDGSIIAYKALRWRDKAEGVMVDIHSGNVTQRLGSLVIVDESMVDKNRRNECSNGLHIARRGYLGGFRGDVCVIAKIAPEDIITVPHGDANKVRVCAYHIVDIINADDYAKLLNNRPMTDTKEAQAQVAKALVGDHIGKIEEVRITQQRGGGLVISSMENGVVVAKAPIKSDHRKAEAVPLDTSQTLDAEKVDPNATAASARTTAPKPQTPPAKAEQKVSTREMEAQNLYSRMTDKKRSDKERRQAAEDLKNFKQKAKVGWSKLGFDSDAVADEIKEILELTDKKPEPQAAKPTPKKATKPAEPKSLAVDPKTVAEQVAKTKPEPKAEVKTPAPKAQGKAPTKPAVKKASATGFKKATAKPVETSVSAPKPVGARQLEAERLLERMNNPALTLKARQQTAKELKDFKSKAKVSWIALGLKGDVGDQVQKVLDQKAK